MSHPEHRDPTLPFAFTEQEQLYNHLTTGRFEALLSDPQTRIHQAQLSSNDYGEFLFVTVSREAENERTLLTFYGYGYHDYRERWITETWSWYQSRPHGAEDDDQLTVEEVRTILEERRAAIAPYLANETQTKRGKLYEMIADLTDDDGAITDMEDLSDWLLGDDTDE